MLYTLLVPFAEDFQIFNLFRYLTFRAGGAVLTAMFIWFVFGRQFINWLRALQIDGQPIRRDGPLSHINKRGTPTMGGMLILLAVSISTLLWADLSNIYVWIVMLVTLGFGLVGFVDDMRKMIRRSSKGLSPALRLFVQFSITAVAVAMVMHEAAAHYETHLALPFVKDFMLNLGWFYIPFAMLVVVGASNAVNLTDGLDGLAIVPIMIVACGLGIISYVVGNAVFADYLQVHPMMGAGELVIFSAAVLGAGLGFLWYNAPPAMVFMGDTGSLSLGAALGMISVITKHEIVLAIMGGLFVLEAVSVIVQVLVHRLTGQRIFLMAPIHHHFEKKGWAEPTVVIRFWIIAFVLALVALSTLKLR